MRTEDANVSLFYLKHTKYSICPSFQGIIDASHSDSGSDSDSDSEDSVIRRRQNKIVNPLSDCSESDTSYDDNNDSKFGEKYVG